MEKLRGFIKKIVENYFSEYQTDVEEPSILDKYYEKKLGYSTEKEPTTINAEVFGYIKKAANRPLKDAVILYKNPKSLLGFGNNTRGIILENGDFYLAENANALHYNIIELLESKNILKFGDKDNYFETYPDNFVAVVRAGGTNGFGQSSAYEDFPIYYQQIFDNAESIYSFKFKKYKYDG